VIPSDLRLYTWLDAEEVLSRWLGNNDNDAPAWFVDARAYWDGITLRIRRGHISDAEKWLRDLFEPRIEQPKGNLFAHPRLLLESSSGVPPRTLPILIEETDEPTPELRIKLSFTRPVLVQPDASGPLSPAALPDGSPTIFAFHSFKGGVGRTLHALALAAVLVESRRSVLLVDADLEAPGISWMIEDRLPDPPIFFADFLALVHGDPDPSAKSSIILARERLQDAMLDGIYVLPAFRSARAFHALEIRPEHLLQGRKDQFFLTNLLASLGSSLKVDAVIVDLRAGLSELAAGLLLDPRIVRAFVTSLSGQALNGTESLLNILAKRAPAVAESHPFPIAIINQVPLELWDSEVLARAQERMLSAISLAIKDKELDTTEVLPGPSWFNQDLLTLSSSWDDALAAVHGDSIRETIHLVAGLVPSRQAAQPVLDIERKREELAKTAGTLIFAEKGEDEDFLPTPPLSQLVERHLGQLPASRVVGAKGAGKTFTYLQMVRRKDWAEFAADLREAAGRPRYGLSGLLTTPAVICPVLQPLNVSGPALDLLDAARESARTSVGGNDALSGPEVQVTIRKLLQDDGVREERWREHWLDLMAWSVGFKVGETGVGGDLSEHLASRKQRLLLVFDGLEDTFQDLPLNQSEQRALRSLLQDVPTWLEQQPERSIGTLVFVRRDMVLEAGLQNSAPSLSRYELKWEKIDALRLVLWTAKKANLFDKVTVQQIQEMNGEAIADTLASLWGKRLGQDNSREGRSADGVITALSDFRGQVQARDLVRLLHLAAIGSKGNTQWLDRILVPQAIRDAIAECGKARISEIGEENRVLKDAFEKLRALPVEQRNLPFLREEVPLTAPEIKMLVQDGIVLFYEGSYYMAEIYRRALDFRFLPEKRIKVFTPALKRRGSV
jgi:MinD-like ATPase involved in chromosome partitioning or flagellar assembly